MNNISIKQNNSMSNSFIPSIKFCGIRTLEDVKAINKAAKHKALQYAGFVFYPPSKRYLSPQQAYILRQNLDTSLISVGVFVNSPIQSIISLFATNTIAIAQLHGIEDNDYIDRLRKTLPDITIWKAFEIPQLLNNNTADKTLNHKTDQSTVDAITLNETIDAINNSHADIVLIDAGKGSGNTFDWDILNFIKRPFVLAGGISVSLLSEIAKYYKNESNKTIFYGTSKTIEDPIKVSDYLYALDISSGIESTTDKYGKSQKDSALIQEFLDSYDKSFSKLSSLKI